MKIGFVYSWQPANARALELELKRLRELGLDISGVDVNSILGYSMSQSEQDFQYCLRNSTVMAGFQRLQEATSQFSAVVIYGSLLIHPDFVRTRWKDKFVIYWSTDDPVSSVIHTLPYIGIADHVFCQTPHYADGTAMEDWLVEMGAKSTSYAPLGYFGAWMRGKSPQEILERKRDIEISFVGSPSWRKWMLLTLKRRYGKRLRIYSRDWSPLRHFAYDLIKGRVAHVVRPAVDESEVYFRSLLSINSNACSGPSTSRTFHIPICGALQLCDFPAGLEKIFELDEQVVPYEFVNVNSLIAAIENVLADPRRLNEMRRSGFWHVHDHYRFGDLLQKRLKEVL